MIGQVKETSKGGKELSEGGKTGKVTPLNFAGLLIGQISRRPGYGVLRARNFTGRGSLRPSSFSTHGPLLSPRHEPSGRVELLPEGDATPITRTITTNTTATYTG